MSSQCILRNINENAVVHSITVCLDELTARRLSMFPACLASTLWRLVFGGPPAVQGYQTAWEPAATQLSQQVGSLVMISCSMEQWPCRGCLELSADFPIQAPPGRVRSGVKVRYKQ